MGESSRILRTRRHFSCEAPRHGAPPHDRSFDNEPPRAGQRRLNQHTHSLHTHTHLISPYSIHHHPPPSPQPTRSANSPPPPGLPQSPHPHLCMVVARQYLLCVVL